MTRPNVSIVVATYNYGRFLPEAINSILAQTFIDWEAIIVDDGSTDDTLDVVQPFLAEPRIRYFRTDHVGQPAAKNYGIQKSRGLFVAFLDADDRWFPDKLTKQIPLFASDRVAVVYSRRKTMDEQGQELVKNYLPPQRGDVLRSIFKDNFVCFSSAVVRRDVLQTIDGFEKSIPLAIDYDLWLRIAKDWEFDYVDEPLVWYRTGHANLSRRTHERIQIVLRIMDRFSSDPTTFKRLGATWIKRCYAETYCSVARANRKSPAEQRRWLLRSLIQCPLNFTAVKELIKTLPPVSWLLPKPPPYQC